MNTVSRVLLHFRLSAVGWIAGAGSLVVRPRSLDIHGSRFWEASEPVRIPCACVPGSAAARFPGFAGRKNPW